jgi:hypothetical protein
MLWLAWSKQSVPKTTNSGARYRGTPKPSLICSEKTLDEKIRILGQKSPRLANAIVALVDDCLARY